MAAAVSIIRRYKSLANPVEVKFQFFQYLLSPITGDRITLGVVYWEGENIRSSFVSKLADRILWEHNLKEAKELFYKGIRSFKKSETPSNTKNILWSQIHTTTTTCPERHFDELIENIDALTLC